MRKTEKFFRFLFWLYFILLFLIVILKFDGDFDGMRQQIVAIQDSRANGYPNYNLELFGTINRYLRVITSKFAYINLASNIICFVPMGFLLPAGYRRLRNFFAMFFSCLFIIFAIEVLQYVTMLGYFDVDDILLNMIGCIMGYTFFQFFRIITGRA